MPPIPATRKTTFDSDRMSSTTPGMAAAAAPMLSADRKCMALRNWAPLTWAKKPSQVRNDP